MNKMKFFIAGCLFSSMFGGSWLINDKIKREYVETSQIEDLTVQLSNSETPIDFLSKDANRFEKFKPREYVRVVTR